MSKRLMSLLAALLSFTLIAAACGDDDDDVEEDDSSEVEEGTDEGTTEEEDDADMEEDSDMEDSDMEDGDMDEGDMEDGEGEAGSEEPGTIVDVAVESGEFPTLVAAVQAAGLDETLAGEGPFTVLAPTEEAFAAALEALELTAEELLADEELLTAVLTYHVIPGENLAEAVVTLDGQDVETVNGATVAISVDGETVMVNDATVIQTDIMASNGVIHVIDTVLVPPAE